MEPLVANYVEAFQPITTLLAGLIGACIGSFITLITYRLPRDEPVGMTRSRCPACMTTLSATDLIPLLSWLLTLGKCRYCKAGVSIRYPLTELACAAGVAAVVWFGGMNLAAIALAGLWWCVVAIIITDLEHYIILDEVQLAVGLLGLLYSWANYAPHLPLLQVGISALVGLAIGLALKYGFLYLRNKDGLGMGDVKFLFVAGIWLGSAMQLIPFLFFSGMLGVVSGLIWRMLGLGDRFPFGPSLAVALLVCVVFPAAPEAFWAMYH